MTVHSATVRDLKAIAKRSPDLAESALAATALALAQEIDGDNSATSKSMCARALTDVLQQLRDIVPPEEKKDAIDELKAKRLARRGGTAA